MCAMWRDSTWNESAKFGRYIEIREKGCVTECHSGRGSVESLIDVR